MEAYYDFIGQYHNQNRNQWRKKTRTLESFEWWLQLINNSKIWPQSFKFGAEQIRKEENEDEAKAKAKELVLLKVILILIDRLTRSYYAFKHHRSGAT